MALAHSEGAVLAARETLQRIDHRVVVGKSPYADRSLVALVRSMELPLYPRLRVYLQTRFAGELPGCVRAGEFDLAVVTNPLADAHLTCTPLCSKPFAVVLPEGHECVRQTAVMLKDLASTPWILFERHIHPTLYDSFRKRARELAIGPEVIHHIADAEEACEMVRQTGGVAFLTPHGAERAATDTVVIRYLGEPELFLSTQLVVHAENRSMLISEFVRTFVKRLKLTGLYQPRIPEIAIDADRPA